MLSYEIMVYVILVSGSIRALVKSLPVEPSTVRDIAGESRTPQCSTHRARGLAYGRDKRHGSMGDSTPYHRRHIAVVG